MNKDRLIQLYRKYQSKTLLADEREEWQALLADPFLRETFEQVLDLDWQNLEDQELMAMDQSRSDLILDHVLSHSQNRVKLFSLWRMAAAASVILCLSVAAYFFINKEPVRQQLSRIAPLKNDLLPGSNKAILTLAGGKQIVLTGARNGKLAMQGKVAINKTADGRIIYDAGAPGRNEEVSYNTMTIPRGGQYHLTLADGTNVWLNAASSITYPTAFPGKDRAVEITGEAYFEVAHNAAKPFRVKSNGQTVEVLGTHFNINAYSDEPAMKTTLFEGSVKVSKGSSTALLKPGQQSAVAENSGKIKITADDEPDQALAWKNGKFCFDKADIQAVMRQIARWYDVDVNYVNEIPNKRFSGKFSRNMNASKALSLLEYTGVNFKIEGRKIIVK